MTGVTATGGAEVWSTDDGSLRARLERWEPSVYRIEATAQVDRVAAIKLRVLPDPSLKANGPGLATNGNFILSQFRLDIVSDDGSVTPVDLVRSYADHAQDAWTTTEALVGDDETRGWAIEGGIGRAHEALFAPATSVALPAGSRLVFRLRQGTAAFPDHQIGHFRLQVTADPRDFAPGNHSRLRRVVIDDSPVDPFQLAVAADGRVFYIERLGAIKVCDPVAGSTRSVGHVEVYSQLDDGMLGLALDPGFLSNGWIYLCYSSSTASENLVSRFTLREDGLDRESERVLLRIPVQRETPPCHTGGSLAFDAAGNLFISTGDNINPYESDGFNPADERPDRAIWDAQGSAGNSLDLRGKILRITPQPDGTYTIPVGNLFAADDPLARPEIYVMGCRNPFRMSVDARTGTVYWGDVGPDAPTFDLARGSAGYDEINQARVAGNFGWPFFIADSKPYFKFNYATGKTSPAWDAQGPRNDSPHNTGRHDLPAVQPAFIWYPYAASAEFPEVGMGGRCSMAGPVYHYDPALDSPHKLPADFDRHLFIYDWMRGWIIAVGLDENDQATSFTRVLVDVPLRHPMDLELGPDGALYLIEWGTQYDGGNADARLSRIEPMPLDDVDDQAEAAPADADRALAIDDYLSALPGGNIAAGRRLFHDGNHASCLSCHRLDGTGGVTGPPLDGCGDRLTPEEIMESILLPSRQIATGYGLLMVTLHDGSVIAGTLQADTETELELLTPERGAVVIEKIEVATRGDVISVMPAVAGTLSPADVADLVAFLGSLRATDVSTP